MVDGSNAIPNKVVIQFGDRIVKGIIEPAWKDLDDVFSSAHASWGTVRVRHSDGDAIEDIHLGEAKGVFFVESFDGAPERHPLNFHSRAPVNHWVWMRFHFRDGEVIEGLVPNSFAHLGQAGFFVVPTDPLGNNKLVYVNKSWLTDAHVLGVRKL
jgi:hypothetical protein